jgi:hypothetical protein
LREFRTIREAKEYLTGRIVDEAKRESTPLTEIERKMLYFTETGWTLPDMMAVSAEFDREYDQDEYEQKIGGLVQRLLARDEAQTDRQAWDDAVVKLADEDHYLLVLINATPVSDGSASSRWQKLSLWMPTWDPRARRDPKDALRLFVIASAFTVALLICFLVAALFK